MFAFRYFTLLDRGVIFAMTASSGAMFTDAPLLGVPHYHPLTA